MKPHRFLLVCVLLGLLVAPFQAIAGDGGYHVLPYASGLEAPRGLTIDANGHLVAALNGSGDGHRDSRIVRFQDLNGDWMADNGAEMQDLVNGMPTASFRPGVAFGGQAIHGIGDVQFSAEGEIYFLTGAFEADRSLAQWHAIWSTAAPPVYGNPLITANPYANFWAYELANNPDGSIIESLPYALVLDANNNAYVSDAAANTIWLVTPEGVVSTFAVLPTTTNTSGTGAAQIHTVPTGLVWGPDGALYMGSETGGPFPEGASAVWRLSDDNGDGDAMDAGEMSQYATGLTTVTDIAFDHDGRLLALEFRGFLKGEDWSSGRVMRQTDTGWEVLAGGLTTPTGMAIGWDGTIYVTLEYIGQIVQIRQ